MAEALMTPAPHFKPGYTGYLEADKFKIGGTIAQRSHTAIGQRCANSPKMRQWVHSSPSVSRPKTAVEFRQTPPVGYTGYIPKSHINEGIGERYATRASNGFESQERHYRRTRSKMDNLRASEIEQLQARIESNRTSSVRSMSAQGVHPMSHPHAPGKLNPPENPAPKVPYSKSCEEDLRFFKSGYTGYLPRSRDYFAVGLTQMSNSALKRMDSEMMTGRYCPFPRQELKPNESKVCDTRVSLGQGMKPGYTGYIPGSKFRFARTYGRISYDAFNAPTEAVE